MPVGSHNDRGAHFFRCDFQVHTPRDNQWSGDRPVEPGDRDAFASSLVAHCRSIGLDAVAITDHHDFAFFPRIKSAAENELRSDGSALAQHERLVVFPGLELTLGTPTFQAILILDADFPIDRLADVLHALSVEVVDDSEPRLPSVESIDHLKSPLDLYTELARIFHRAA